MALNRRNVRLISVLSVIFLGYYFFSRPYVPSLSRPFPSSLSPSTGTDPEFDQPEVVRFSNDPSRRPFPEKHSHLQVPIPPPPTESLTSTFHPTVQLGNIEGYNVFKNLYLYNGQLVAATTPDDDPIKDSDVATSQEEKPKSFVHAQDGQAWWKETTAGSSDAAAHSAKARVFDGVSMIFHDPAGPGGYMVFHMHFAPEVYIPSLRALALAGVKDVPSRLIFPHCSEKQDEDSWKDSFGSNAWLVNVTLPGAELIYYPDWKAYQRSGDIIVFDKVVVVDRWAAHQASETHRWGKMMSKIASVPFNTPKNAGPVTWFEPYRSIALNMLGSEVDTTSKRPVVVYLTREVSHLSPSLSRDAYQDLVKSLRRLAGHAEVHLTISGNIDRDDLLPLLARTNVLISHTGNELTTNLFWLQPGATVIEFFDERSFSRTNEMMSSLFGFKHVIIRNDQVYEKEQWLIDGQQQNEDGDSTEMPLKGEVVERVVREALRLPPA